MAKPDVRHLEEFQPLPKAQFRERFMQRFYDPAFDDGREVLDKICDRAWDGYHVYRKSPRKKPAGEGFVDPAFELPIEWLAARAAIVEAQARQADPAWPARFLLVNGSTRSEHSCPGETSKTRRRASEARDAITAQAGFEVDFLDLSTLADEPLKIIHPCKACVSTSMPLCHWPCSCYPHHAMGQTTDWMSDLYPRWVAAHGVMILCPVHWYQAPASLKLMMDRLVCADGGNPDPTATRGKDVERAKQIELDGWDYPKHLAGRAFAVVTHADAAGPENLRRMLTDWLTDIGMIQAGPTAVKDTFIGYYRPYATSHEDLDANTDVFIEVRNAALSLVEMVRMIRAGDYEAPDRGLEEPRQK
jgi:multimeric flavodoxin WrbA